MQVTRSLGFIGVLGACWFVSAGCSSDNSTNAQSDGGSGGTGGTGGAKPGTGGKAAGGASSGGKSGSGGASSGGKSSSGGASSGGAGGMNGSGGAVEGGTPEGGPEGGVHPPTAKSCGYRCNTDRDCLTGSDAGPGPDATYKCNPTRKRCENPIEVCNSNDDCMALASFWLPACTGDADCFPGDVCVDAGGYGMCATVTPADAGACFLAPEAVVRQKFGSAGTATVCGSTAGRCSNHRCSIGCTSDPDFCSNNPGFGSTCNATSGLCGCATNADCTATGVSVCNGTTHHCECATNADCASSPGGDVCVNGSCGCSGTSVCTVQFRNATSVCE